MAADNPTIIAQINETYRRTVECIEMLGRLEIIDEYRLNSEWDASSKLSFADECTETAKRSGASVLIILTVYQTGANSFGEAVIRPVDPSFESIKKNIRVRTQIMRNVPYLIVREIALLHQKQPIRYQVKEENGKKIIDAGSRSGLTGGMYPTKKGSIRITNVSERYSEVQGAVESRGEILIYPKVTGYLKEIETAIQEGIEYRYGPGYAYLRGGEYNKRYLESVFVINPLGNVLLPGYSSWLTVNYLGIEGPKPSYLTMGAGASVYLYQLLWMPVSSGFSENFFPFVNGSKTEAQRRYHTWLWATIPVNFTVCYFDHLALQYKTKQMLPPFFSNKDITAAAISVIVPGGGHFYKGDRMFGWSYYGTEFLLFSYGIYHAEEVTGKRVLLAAGVVKMADIIHAYFSKPSYLFYNREIYREETTSFFSDVVPDGDVGISFLSGISRHY